ncbi:MAG: ATP-binding protein [Lachnospiraceae bacterium]|nr:ATP-binding protein [Lachnospiraceae bacterium]
MSNKTEQIITSDTAHKPLPIGISDYKEAVSDYYYVDKTLLIKDFLDTIPKVSLFTRPRRFGKTLNMDMLRVFFEKTKEDTSVYFQDKKIWGCGDKYRSHQGKYPVIFLTFKDLKFHTWNETLEKMRSILANEFARHGTILSNSIQNDFDLTYYQKITNKTATEVEVTDALSLLSRVLHECYQIAPIMIIDEYDTPIQQGYLSDFYEHIIFFMRNLFSGGFKDNHHLSYGFMTGILRVAKESIFSGMNNLRINSIMENRYSSYFGFTKEEIRHIVNDYHLSDKFDEICSWYDGYRFGDEDIFNPWSVLNYLDNNATPGTFWQSTGDNSIIRQIVASADEDTTDHLRRLMNGESISAYVDMSVIYPEIQQNPSTIYSFLLAAGYLKQIKQQTAYNGDYICDLAIPNQEIGRIFEKEILSALSATISQSTAATIRQAMKQQDIPTIEKSLRKFLRESISSFDYAQETFYHGLLLGLTAVMNNLYRVTSNRESGMGRYDIQLKPLDPKLPGILIEVKVLPSNTPPNTVNDMLKELSQTALIQIDQKNYADDMRKDGMKQILKIGVACYHKDVVISSVLEGNTHG